ncbi:hypothetical protein [Massilia pseudoviolaceinigra]|uniref:hypothetical protein n=1 Tax=Massilia pseudoviolaceinigra TaxID=3057165 RepID=UPI002796B619|nr:hypothetical protein [Massilia sp. CCM 9206]MDQ1918818.1 hypothetical protein [Massilia sp. CCM 9206]
MSVFHYRACTSRGLASLGAVLLAACGGGGSAPDQVSASAPTAPLSAPPAALAGEVGTQAERSALLSLQPANPLTPAPPLGLPAPIGTTLTTLQLINKSTYPQYNVPLTFGQVFAPGTFPAAGGLAGVYAGAALPLQVNIKARHADGSVRHAIITAVLPQMAAGQNGTLALNAAAAPPVAATGPEALLASGFDSTVKLTLAGQLYTASAAELLRGTAYQTWLSGPMVNEWQVSAPFKSAAGVNHPHLSARFAIRSNSSSPSARGKVRVDVTVENNWAYEPAPKTFTYDAEVLIRGKSIYNIAALQHYHHARWRKVFWPELEPSVHIKHDTAYLIASKAVPNYDQSLTISPDALTTMKTTWDTAKAGPMGMAMVVKYMPATGGRPDIGLNHAWGAMYLLSMDERAKEVTVGLSDLSGSWPMHYRDSNTGQPVSIVEYPYVRDVRISSDSYNRALSRWEDMPQCTPAIECKTPYTPETAHHPSFSYLPYLVTGDTYHLDELHFWANWNLITQNPAYRRHATGLVMSHQVRGQAWSLRSLTQAAYIAPDDHPLKGYFNKIVDNNLDWYTATYVTGNSNQLGFLDNSGGSAVVYGGPGGPKTGMAPWQDDFFTSSVGQAYELGFTKSKTLLDWKARFPVGRMTAPGYCWVDGAEYALSVRATATSPYFTTFGQAWQATVRAADNTDLVNSTGQRYVDQPCGSQLQADWRTQRDRDEKRVRAPWLAGEMTGYASSPEGFPANMQPALAMAAGTGIPNARAAWDVFARRALKPDYTKRPQFAIVPR